MSSVIYFRGSERALGVKPSIFFHAHRRAARLALHSGPALHITIQGVFFMTTESRPTEPLADGNAQSGSTADRPRLQRLAIALRSTNWFAVAVEMVVVTAGVLLAFQIEQWSESRRERREERRFMERLWDETAALEESLRDFERGHSEKAAGLRTIHGSLNNLTVLHDNSKTMCRIAVLPSSPQPPTLSEISSTNRMDILQDLPLKQALRKLISDQTFAAGQLGYFRQGMARIRDDLSPFIENTLDTATSATNCKVDWVSLRADRTARSAVASAFHSQSVFSFLRGGKLRSVRTVRARLACLLDKPDCRSIERRRPD